MLVKLHNFFDRMFHIAQKSQNDHDIRLYHFFIRVCLRKVLALYRVRFQSTYLSAVSIWTGKYSSALGVLTFSITDVLPIQNSAKHKPKEK